MATDSQTTGGVLVEGYRIIVDAGGQQVGHQAYGYFATEKEAMDYAMLHRSRLGLDRCVSWHVEHSNA